MVVVKLRETGTLMVVVRLGMTVTLVVVVRLGVTVKVVLELWGMVMMVPTRMTVIYHTANTGNVTTYIEGSNSMAVASGGQGGQLQKSPLKNTRNQNTYLNVWGVLGTYDYS